MSSTILISGGTLPDGTKSDLLIKDGKISEIAAKIEKLAKSWPSDK